MRVLHIINSLDTGGAEKLLVDALPLYQKAGIEVALLTIKDSQGFFAQALLAQGIRIYSLGANSVYHPLNIFKIIPYLSRYDIIHAHLFPAQYWVSFAKLFSLAKTTLVFTEHSTSNRRWGRKLFYIFDYLSYAQFKKIGCITVQVKERFDHYFPRMASKTIVINNGIVLNNYMNANAYDRNRVCQQLSENDRLLIQVSAFRSQKDQDTVIRAMRYLPSQYKLLLVGEGNRLGFCKKLVHELELNDRVFFLGNRSDVPQLLKTAWLAVQSSHSEGFGLAAVEAMATGIPVIATRVSGLAEVIGKDELLFEQGDSTGLAERILYYANHPIAYQLMIQYCTDRAKQYDIMLMVQKYGSLYKKMITE